MHESWPRSLYLFQTRKKNSKLSSRKKEDSGDGSSGRLEQTSTYEVHVMRSDHRPKDSFQSADASILKHVHYVDLCAKGNVATDVCARLGARHVATGWPFICGAALDAYRNEYCRPAHHAQKQDESGLVHSGGAIQVAIDSIMEVLMGREEDHAVSRDERGDVMGEERAESSATTPLYCGLPGERQFFMADRRDKNLRRQENTISSSENVLSLDMTRSLTKETHVSVFLLSARDPRLSHAVEDGIPWAFNRLLQMSKDFYNEIKSSEQVEDGAARTWVLPKKTRSRKATKSTSSHCGKKEGHCVALNAKEAAVALHAAMHLRESQLSDAVAARTGSQDIVPTSRPQQYILNELGNPHGAHAEMTLSLQTRKRVRTAALMAQSHALEDQNRSLTSTLTEVNEVSKLTYRPTNFDLTRDDNGAEVDLAGVVASTLRPASTLEHHHCHPQRESSQIPASVGWYITDTLESEVRSAVKEPEAAEYLMQSLDLSVLQAVRMAVEEICRARLVDWRDSGQMLPRSEITKDLLKAETEVQLSNVDHPVTSSTLRSCLSLLMGPEKRMLKTIGATSASFDRFLKLQVFQAHRAHT